VPSTDLLEFTTCIHTQHARVIYPRNDCKHSSTSRECVDSCGWVGVGVSVDVGVGMWVSPCCVYMHPPRFFGRHAAGFHSRLSPPSSEETTAVERFTAANCEILQMPGVAHCDGQVQGLQMRAARFSLPHSQPLRPSWPSVQDGECFVSNCLLYCCSSPQKK
jgi:hypothetical protein